MTAKEKHTFSELSTINTSQAKQILTDESLLRVDTCCECFGVHKSTWFRWVSAGVAPKGIRVSAGITVWRKSELDTFMAKLLADGGAS